MKKLRYLKLKRKRIEITEQQKLILMAIWAVALPVCIALVTRKNPVEWSMMSEIISYMPA